MRVIRAEELGMCFGVRDALGVVEAVPDPTQVTIHGELVHNPSVARRLRAVGFRQSPEDRRGSARTPLVLITAHGVSDAERKRLAAANKDTIDTTCPLVRRAHDAALELQAESRHVLLIGKPNHVEVRGIVEDLHSYDVIGCANDVRCYQRPRLGVVSQTTMPSNLVDDICSLVQLRNPLADIRLVDTVCQPTKLRQRALLDLVRRVGVVVVVGGRNSNNTRQLVRLCEEHATPARHVEGAKDLDLEWFIDVDTVGLTAGTSTLDDTIAEVQRSLEQMAPRSLQRQATRTAGRCPEEATT